MLFIYDYVLSPNIPTMMLGQAQTAVGFSKTV